MAAKLRGAVAAGHEKTAAAGVEMFHLGGNAFDAAIAAVFASFVTESVLTSPAGGGFLLAHTKTGHNVLFDFFSQTPQRKIPPDQLDFYPIQADFGDAKQEFHIGLGSMATPSNLRGLCHAHQKLGQLPLKIVVEPAIHLAETGFQLDDFRAYCLQILKPILLATEGAQQIYAPHGSLLKAGDTIYMKDLATSFRLLIKEGVEEFYSGEIAHQLIQDCQTQGGYLTLADLQDYQVIERAPLTLNYRGNSLLTNPPPSSGGTLIAFALKLLSQIDLSQISWGSKEHLKVLTEVMRLTNEARRDGYDTHLYHGNIAAAFLSDDHLALYGQQLTDSTLNSTINKWGSTTHVSAIDGDGNAASITTSNGEGSSYIIPNTGIMVNNMLGESDLNPHGFHQWQSNQRISSMMAPTMLLQDQKPKIVLGSGGSNRIRTAILQVISNLIDFELPISKAVNVPRIHWEKQVFNFEPGFPSKDIEAVQAHLLKHQNRIVPWKEKNLFFGGVHAVSTDAYGRITGVGDPRRSGAVSIASI